MISESLKQNYVLLGNHSLYTSRTSQYAMNPLYSLFSDKDQYKEFLHELSSKSPQKISKLETLLEEFILQNVITISKKETVYWGYTDSLILVFLNTNTSYVDQLRQILGSVFVYSVIQNYKDKNMLSFSAPAVNVYSKLFLKCSTRPIDFNEIYPTICRILSAWILKKYNVLSLKNLNILLSNNNVNFVSASDTQALIEKMSSITRVDQVLDWISNELKTTTAQLVTTFASRYSMDFLLGIENLYHFVYMVGTAYSLLFPNNLYYSLKQLNDKRLISINKLLLEQVAKYQTKPRSR